MAERPVIVLGAGGHAKVVVDLLQKLGRSVAAVVENGNSENGRVVLGVRVQDESTVLNYSPDQIDLALGVGMPTQNPVAGLLGRNALAERFRSKGYRFPALTHPSAIIGSETELGDGSQVMAGVVVQPGCMIGEFVIVNTRASIDHDCSISGGSHIAPGAVLGGAVQVGRETLVGIGATIKQGIVIGSRALIAGGAMVASDVPDGEIWMGVPAGKR